MSRFKTAIKNHSLQDALLFAVFGIALLIHALSKHYAQAMPDWKMSPYLFPLLVSIFLILLSTSLAADGRRELKQSAEPKQNEASLQLNYGKKVLFTVLFSIVYYILMPILTFIPSTILFLTVMFLYLGERRPLVIGLISVLTAVFVYALFALGLNVMLP
ncbi:MAG: tripartite tricarboxylate transporter TctB family protein [Eubacteriales bacterium]|nr:tripartite tricarboxylate transporter TctB family protein [Clostridiales bacterium]MDY5836489.1 tripartite tricarboxylate transporter TctB family protein [Eubacteriales bacterium]